MDIKLNIYKDKFCRKLDRTVTAADFELSTGICEDVLDLINIDMFAGGMEALSDESKLELIIGIVKNGYPQFKALMQELFELTDDEIRNTKIAEIAVVVKNIVEYSFTTLASALGGNKQKN